MESLAWALGGSEGSGVTPPRVRIEVSGRTPPPRRRQKNADLKALMPIFLEFCVLIWAR